ncbi:hypothetical protein [Dactylosporangium sp. NPDC051541]|uniref:hypothetical protein n=1 Tax=Dactylosporangium sp. NPDC051541 TaxID=3363977 RepID=UPI0037B27FDB
MSIDRYGDGAMPRIAAAGAADDAVRLFNQEYWTIRDLDVSNAAPAGSTAGANLRQGIGSLPDDAALLNLTTDHGPPAARPDGAYTLDGPATTRTVTVTPETRSRFATAAGATVTVADTPTDVPVTVTAEDGTRRTNHRLIRRLAPSDGAATAPAEGVLSSTSGRATGLHDGDYTVSLTAATPSAQHASTVVSGRAPGTYTYEAELVNAAGATRSAAIIVEVR